VRLGLFLATLLVGGACAAPGRESSSHPPAPEQPVLATEPAAREPSELLWLVRDERLSATSRRVATTTEPSAATTLEAETSPDPEVRLVFVPRAPGLATPETLARAVIRDAEMRRPRALYVSRLLLRISGPIGDDGDPRVERTKVRALANDLVDAARPALQLCLAESLAEDPQVAVKAPALLVIKQAMSAQDLVYAFSPTLDAGPRGVKVRTLEWRGDAPDHAPTACLLRALETASDGVTPPLLAEHRMEVPLVAFSQHGWGFNLDGLHGAIALEAAEIGWQRLEQGEHEAALELFRDAYWVFHLAELRYLEGLALERLGRSDAAADAYAEYLVARPYAPEAPALPGRIERLRTRVPQ